MINVYQNQALSENHNKINAYGWETAKVEIPGVKAHLDCSTSGAKKWLPEYFETYKLVAKVDSDDKNFVFEAMNIWEGYEDYIEMVGKAHSLSVGDIIQVNGDYFMVDPYGYSQVEVKQ